MNQKEFSFEKLPDLITPRTLVEANYPGGKNAVYALFAKNNFPAVRHGKKFLVSKAALLSYFRAK
ncbi:MAG TPA: hypothetical protein PKV15_07165 [Syntrophomonadaceae bacterium]|jgi:hypothetical protein|nr:hypothetical protein [Syntrophomonadaceae bacterium]HPF44463.1 hypothetical protein [Syntrophomonadaceae bacterium]